MIELNVKSSNEIQISSKRDCFLDRSNVSVKLKLEILPLKFGENYMKHTTVPEGIKGRDDADLWGAPLY